MMIWLVPLFVLVSSQLLMVKIHIRHGARYPFTNTYLNIPAAMEGQLTKEGKRMHYLLGRYLYREYWSRLYLDNTHNQKNMHVVSSDFNRTIESAQSLLLGLFEDLKKQSLNGSSLSEPAWTPIINDTINGGIYGNLNYQPIPIHVNKRFWNVYQRPTRYHSNNVDMCPNVEKWYGRNQESTWYKQRFQPIMDNNRAVIEKYFGRKLDIDQMIHLMDAYYANISLGNKIAQPLNNVTILKDLQYLYLARHYIEGHLSDYQINATASGTFSILLEQLQKGKDKQGPKIYLDSGHDSDIITHLTALRVMNKQCSFNHYLGKCQPNMTYCEGVPCIYDFPKYSSNLIYELHQEKDEYFIKIRYNGRYLRLQFCQYPCPYEQFTKFLKQTIKSDYKSICGFVLDQMPVIPDTKSQQRKYIIAIVVITILLVVYFTVKLLSQIIRKKRPRRTIKDSRKLQSEKQIAEEVNCNDLQRN